MPTELAAYDEVQQVLALDARDFWYSGNRVKVHVDAKDTNGQFSLLEFWQKQGSQPPLHYHANEDETFVVLEGELMIRCGSEERILRAGESIFAPRGVPHTFCVRTPQAHTMTVFTPAGFEDFFRTLGQPLRDDQDPQTLPLPSPAKIGEAALRFGSYIV